MSATTAKAWHLLLQNGRCVLCGEPMFLDRGPHAYGGPTFEHKTPQHAGGAFGRSNRALSHRECNQWRGKRAVLSCVRPPELHVAAPEGRRPLVPMSGVWFSHFRLPLTDPRWRHGSDSTEVHT